MCGGSTWDHAEWRPFSGIAPEAPTAASLVEAEHVEAERAPSAAA